MIVYSSDKAVGFALASTTGSGAVLLSYPNALAFLLFVLSAAAAVSAWWLSRKERLATVENRLATDRALTAIQLNQIRDFRAQAELADMVAQLKAKKESE